jgi:transposase
VADGKAIKCAFQNLRARLWYTRPMSKRLVPDELWTFIEPLLPVEPAKPKGGRPRVSDRAALGGILFVRRTGIPWSFLPAEMGCGSGSTCWRRLRDWQAAGVWARLHRALLDRLGDADQLDWSRAALDSASVPAKRGATRPGRIRRIAAKRARSARLWSRPGASRSR